MNRIKETITTLLSAARYSFAFAWRNSKSETVARIVLALLETLLIFLSIQSTGMIINSVQKSIDKFGGEQNSFSSIMSEGLWVPITFLASILLLGTIVGQLSWFFGNKWRMTLRFRNTKEINDHKGTLDVARFRSKEFDDLEKRISELPNSWNTRIGFSEEMLAFVTICISFFIFGASLLWYQPYYALVILLGSIPTALFKFKTVSLWWNLFLELVPQHKKRYVLERSYHATMAFVQALMFDQMPHLRKQIDKNVGDVLKDYSKIRNKTLRNELLTKLVAVVTIVAVVTHAIWSAVLTSGEVGTLMIVIAATRTFQGNIQQIITLVAEQWNSAKGVIMIEKDYFGMKPYLSTKNPVVPKFTGAPLIKFDNVSFAYPDTDTLVLKDVSFEIKPGEKVAIVGKSGNGKSTIQALLMRYYDPTSGAIYVDDDNLNTIKPNDWSQVATALTQEYSISERLIGAEIASSRLDKDIDMEIVSASARFADFQEVVDSDPLGYESQIGIEYGGREFSGGERQRLALARSHYRGTPILILDEPDAKLDVESAENVINQVFALKGVTVILITHHVSRAKRCDQIILMGKGEILEKGTHDELVELDGKYTSLYEKDKQRLGH
ncbi:MAG: ABC transporter ATP-binding protein [Candidatus Pacebacteria bacterium]|nr:ABC transporter ATP-binding protein [Candidatus Paceibacterota bacterium]